MSGQGGNLEEGRAWIQQALDAVANEQLALFPVAADRLFPASRPSLGQPSPEVGRERTHVGEVLEERRGVGFDVALEDGHD